VLTKKGCYVVNRISGLVKMNYTKNLYVKKESSGGLVDYFRKREKKHSSGNKKKKKTKKKEISWVVRKKHRDKKGTF